MNRGIAVLVVCAVSSGCGLFEDELPTAVARHAHAPGEAWSVVAPNEWTMVPVEHADEMVLVEDAISHVVARQQEAFARTGYYVPVGEAIDSVPEGVTLYARHGPEDLIVAGVHRAAVGSGCIAQIAAAGRDITLSNGGVTRVWQAFGMKMPNEDGRIQCTGNVPPAAFATQWQTRR